MLDRTLAPEIQKISEVEFQHVDQTYLENGVGFAKLIAGEQPVVKIEVIFPNAGNRFEGIKGQASMAIRMLKEGTTSYSSIEITNLFSRLGAHVELNPGFDNASYSIYCLDKHFEEILPVFSEMMESPSFDNKELELQKQLQIAQLQIQNKKNNILASKGIRQAIFGPEHPYGRVISEHDLQVLSAGDLKEFWSEVNTNCQVLISGRPSEKTLDALQELFGSKRKFDPSQKSTKKIFSESMKPESNESVQASIRLGKTALLKRDPDYIPFLVTNHLLGGFFGSRLMKNIREDKGLTYGISSSIVPLQEESYWVVGAEVNTDNVDMALKEIHHEINRLADFNDHEELETAKTHMIGSFQAELNSPFALMNRYKAVNLHGLDYDYYQNLFKTLAAFGPEDLRQIAHTYFIEGELEKVVFN